MGGSPGWWEEVCSAGGVDVGADANAVSVDFGQMVPSPGSGPQLHVDQQVDPGKPWEQVALAVHFERLAAGADAGLPPL